MCEPARGRVGCGSASTSHQYELLRDRPDVRILDECGILALYQGAILTNVIATWILDFAVEGGALQPRTCLEGSANQGCMTSVFVL